MSEIRYTNNKPQFVDGIISDTEIQIKELSFSPSSEASIGKIYCKSSDQRIYFKNSSGSEVSITSSDVSLPNNFFSASTPYYYDPNSISLSTSVAISNTIAKTSDNSQNIIVSPILSNETSYQWLFNEGSGSTVSEASGNTYLPISISGTPSWGTGYVGINGTVAANSFTTPTGTLSQLGSFSIGIWVSFPTVTPSRWFLNLTNGSGNAVANYSFALGFDASSNISCTLSNGSGSTNLIVTKTVPTNTKIFIVLTYTRVSAGTSVASLSWTADGNSWGTVSSSSAVLIQQNSTFSLKSRLDATGATGINTNYYRLAVYNNYILSSDDIENLYNLGSESSTDTYKISKTLPTIVDLNNSPRTWLFNETSGTTAFDSSGVTDLTLSGTYTQTSSYLNIDGTNASNLISSSNGAFVDLGNFSTVSWVEFNALPGASALIYGVGLNSTGNANWSWLLRNTSSSIGFQVSNGSTNSQVTANLTLSTGVKYLIITTYQRVGASTSIANVKVTSNGIDWYNVSVSNFVLMQQTTAHPFRNNRTADSLPGNNIRFHRVEIYNNKILSDSEIQDIWNAGSEASFTQKYSSGINSCAVSSNLSDTISSSTTTVTGTGTSFFKDFQIGDIIYSNGQGRRITAIASNTSLTIESSFAANLSTRTYRRGGLGPNTWYYLYAIGNGVTSGYIWSTRDTSEGDILVDLPSGYSYRQTTCILKTDPTSYLYNFQITKGWPYLPTFQYKQTMPAVLTAGGAVGATISATGSIPNNCTQGEFLHTRGGNTAGSLLVIGTGNTINFISYEITRLNAVANGPGTSPIFFVTDNSQNFYYRVDNGTNTVTLTPFSYTITSNNIL